MSPLKLVPMVAFLCSTCIAAQKDAALVLHYAFDEGTGVAVHDKSGQGNDGQIKGQVEWVKEKSYTALRFNGTDTSVECPATASLEIARTRVVFEDRTIAGNVLMPFLRKTLRDLMSTVTMTGIWRNIW